MNEDIFVNKESPFYGIQNDCADAIYTFRAIFSFQNKLPFAIVRPGKKPFPTLNNRTKIYNYVKPEHRFRKFVNYIGRIAGTYHLGKNDTYPIHINQIRPGDLYIFQLKTKEGRKTLAHAMAIKKVNPNGTFDFIYSSQRIKRLNELYFKGKGKEVNLTVKKMQDSLYSPQNSLRGFRRFIWPNYLRKKRGPHLAGYWKDQSKKAREWGERKFLEYVQKNTQKKVERPEVVLKRKLNHLCDLLNQRIDAVNEAISFLKVKKKCLNYNEYDIHSTPMLDFIIIKNYNHLFYTWDSMQKDNLSSDINALMEETFESNNKLSKGLFDFCPLKIENINLSLGQAYYRLKRSLMSANPHDPLKKRWGENKIRTRRKCRAYY